MLAPAYNEVCLSLAFYAQLAKEAVSEPVTVIHCDQTLSQLDAVQEGMRQLNLVEGRVAVIPADMPLLDPSDTLLSMEALMGDDECSAQVCAAPFAHIDTHMQSPICIYP